MIWFRIQPQHTIRKWKFKVVFGKLWILFLYKDMERNTKGVSPAQKQADHQNQEAGK